jgi:hypothetical protein
MKPNKPGIWEWFEEDGTKRLVEVFDVASKLREVNGTEPPYLRVYWWGGYYNVADSPEEVPGDPFCKAEWSDRWGNYVGPNGSVKEEDLYNGPTPEQAERIRKRYSDDSDKVHP